jgi:4-amino-4-deoxy-L-arabinose transferase-like glycosyltransferase
MSRMVDALVRFLEDACPHFVFARATQRIHNTFDAARRREFWVLAGLGVYLMLWTLYGALAKGSQDLSYDMTEELVWARDLSFGFLKHPPLSPLLVKLWFSVLPREDWTFYLLAILVASLALWVAWRLAGDYLDGDKRILALALLSLVPFFNFHALKYNVNTALMPLWGMTTLWFLRSFRTRSLAYAMLAGVGAAAAMLCKYWSIFLIVGLVLAALIDVRRRFYFRSGAPWITIAVGFAVLSPHLIWLVQHDFAPVRYAMVVHGYNSLESAFFNAFKYLAGAAGYVALPVALVLIAVKPRRAVIADMLWPKNADRRLAATAFWAPLLLPAVAAVVAGVSVNSLWSMSAWTLLPVLLLSPPALTVPATATRRILGFAIALPFVMMLAAPIVAIVMHHFGNFPVSAQSRLLSTRVERAWHEMTDQPLVYIDGDVAYSISVYALDHPRALPDLPPVSAEALTRSGMAFVCVYEDEKCIGDAAVRYRKDPASRWSEVTLRRVFLGKPGRPQRYAILIVPPRMVE